LVVYFCCLNGEIETDIYIYSLSRAIKCAAPDAPPQNVTSQNTSSEGIQITWEPPPITNINGILRRYYVIWFETLGEGQEIFNKTIEVQAARRRRRSVSSPTSFTLTLDGLKKFTMYTIRILGFTIANGVFFETNTTTAEDGKCC
jgi:hypothetical protein